MKATLCQNAITGIGEIINALTLTSKNIWLMRCHDSDAPLLVPIHNISYPHMFRFSYPTRNEHS